MRDKGAWGAILLTATTLAFMMLFMRGGFATDNGQYANQPPEVRDWYKQAELTEPAQKRFPFKKCCDHADVVHTQFKKVAGGEWWYMAPEGWKQVPPDIIHWFNSAPNGEPTLFIYAGQETCFFPPNAGI